MRTVPALGAASYQTGATGGKTGAASVGPFVSGVNGPSVFCRHSGALWRNPRMWKEEVRRAEARRLGLRRDTWDPSRVADGKTGREGGRREAAPPGQLEFSP